MKTLVLKKVPCLVLAIITLISITLVSAFAYSSGNYTVNTPSGINVRSGAGTNYSVVGSAANGVSFSVSSTSGSWGFTSSIKTTSGTKSGWVCLDYCLKKSTAKSYCYISYDANGGSGAPSTLKVEKGKSFKLSTSIPKRSGYSFLGWSGNKNGNSKSWGAPGEEINTSLNTTTYITLYAIWLKGAVKTNYSTPLTSGKAYFISPACAPGSVLDVEGGGKNDNTNISIYQKHGDSNQQWKAVHYGSGWYYFVDVNSGKALDVRDGLALPDQNVSTYSINKSNAQLWRLISAGNGYYYLQSKTNQTYYLDVYCGRSDNCTNVQLYYANYSNAQKFKFTAVPALTKSYTGYVNTNSDPLIMRAGPGTSYKALANMPKGSSLTVLDNKAKTNGFYHVKYNGTTGYASSSYITFTKPASQSSYSISNGVLTVKGVQLWEYPVGSAVPSSSYYFNVNGNSTYVAACQCYGYACYIEHKLYGSCYHTNKSHFPNLSGSVNVYPNANQLKELVQRAGVGAHIRTKGGHSMIVIGYDSNGLVIADANASGDYKVEVRSYSWQEYLNRWSSGIAWIEVYK